MFSGHSTTTPSSNAVWGSFNSPPVGKPNNLLFDALASMHQQHAPMQVDAPAPSQLFPPPPQRTTLKKQPRDSLTHGNIPRQVIFSNVVDVRVSLAPLHTQANVWYSAREIKSMRMMALDKRSLQRHSHAALSSTSPQEVEVSKNSHATPLLRHSLVPRVQSASAQLSSSPPKSNGNINLNNLNGPQQDMRYQQQLNLMDREVYITNEQRRNSTRNRLIHYEKVFDDIDRQCDEGYMRLNVQELAHASKMASAHALRQALEKGRREATLAQAIVLEGVRRL